MKNDEIKKAVESYLKNGGKITKLSPEPTPFDPRFGVGVMYRIKPTDWMRSISQIRTVL